MVSIMIKRIIQNFFLYSFSFFVSLFMHRGTILLDEEYGKYYASVYNFMVDIKHCVQKV